MKNPWLYAFGAIFLVAACTSPEETRKQNFRGKQNGDEVYEFRVEHWPTALRSKKKLEAWVKRDATKMCPAGYREVSRRRGAEHVYYGSPIPMPYTDIHVTVECSKGAAAT